jgi:hypothetical protein
VRSLLWIIHLLLQVDRPNNLICQFWTWFLKLGSMYAAASEATRRMRKTIITNPAQIKLEYVRIIPWLPSTFDIQVTSWVLFIRVCNAWHHVRKYVLTCPYLVFRTKPFQEFLLVVKKCTKYSMRRKYASHSHSASVLPQNFQRQRSKRWHPGDEAPKTNLLFSWCVCSTRPIFALACSVLVPSKKNGVGNSRNQRNSSARPRGALPNEKIWMEKES